MPQTSLQADYQFAIQCKLALTLWWEVLFRGITYIEVRNTYIHRSTYIVLPNAFRVAFRLILIYQDELVFCIFKT